MNTLIIAPVLWPLFAGAILLLTRGHLSLPVRRTLNLIATLIQLGWALALLTQVSDGQILAYPLGNWPAPYGIVLVADGLSAWMVTITALLACFTLLHAIHGCDAGARHFQPLFQMQIFGLSGAFLTGDLFNLFVFFEILLLASYGLLVHGGGAARIRAGLHFVVLNLAGSTLFLFAAGTLYATLGTLNMADLAVRIAAVPPENLGLVRVGGLLLFGVFALKAALFPLHLWLPASYAATSAPVAALFAIMTKVGAYGLLRAQTLLFGDSAQAAAHLLEPWILPLALLTMIAGLLGTLAATGLRQQIGFLMLVSVGMLLVACGLNSADGIAAGIYYLAHSTFIAAALFLLADLIERQRGESKDALVAGPVVSRLALTGSLFFIGAILITGLPPLSGFIGKFMVLQASLEHPAATWIFGIVLIAGLGTLVALTRTGILMFLQPQGGAAQNPVPTFPVSLWIPVSGLLLLCLALTVWAGPLSSFTHDIARQLLQPQLYIETVLGSQGRP